MGENACPVGMDFPTINKPLVVKGKRPGESNYFLRPYGPI